MKHAEPIRRTTEIEEITNLHLIHPISSRLVPLFARMRITPNAVSITGMLFGILAGLAYYHYSDPRYALAGFLLMFAWHVFDGADGQLARLTRSQSRFGQVLDGISDNVTFLAVYIALAMALRARHGAWVYELVIAAGLCHAIQSASYEVQRQEYDIWARGRGSVDPPRGPDPSRGPGASRGRGPSLGADTTWLQRLFDLLHLLFYGRLSFPAAHVTRRFRTAMSAALERRPERADLIRRRYRETFAPLLRRWSLLCANYRTLGIFVCALLGVPEYYFGFEIVGFSAILAVLIERQSALGKRFFATLEEAAPSGAAETSLT